MSLDNTTSIKKIENYTLREIEDAINLKNELINRVNDIQEGKFYSMEEILEEVNK